MKGIPFSESSPNIMKTKIPVKDSLSKSPKAMKVKKAKLKSIDASKPQKIKTEKNKPKNKAPAAVKAKVMKKTVKPVKNDYSKATIITRAAVRRIAAKHDIPQISSDCVDHIIKHITSTASLCLLRARSSARHISRTRTIQVPDLASAARGCKMGDLIHA